MSRKLRSEQFLREHGVRVNENLPEIAATGVKSPEEIVKRGVTAFLTAQIAIDVSNGENGKQSAEFFSRYLKRFNLENELSADEKKYFDLVNEDSESISEQDAGIFSWRIEMCMPLFWACGFQEEPWNYPCDISDPKRMSRLIDSCHDFNELMEHVKMRSDEEILDSADLVYRMDWACVEARLKNEHVTGYLNSDVVLEKHKGFNWLVGACDSDNWDTVKPNT